MKKLVLIDSDPHARQALVSALDGHDRDLFATGDPHDGLQVLRFSEPDLAVLALDPDPFAGLSFLQVVRESYPVLPVVAVGRVHPGGPDILQEALLLGASDTVLAPVGADKIRRAVARILSEVDLREAVAMAAFDGRFSGRLLSIS